MTADEAKHCRELFRLMQNDDFDTREKAANELMAFGPAVLDVAREFFKDADSEVASQARTFSDKLVTQYDGYLPHSPRINEALGQRLILDDMTEGKKATEVMAQLAEKAGLRLVIDPSVNVRELPLTRGFLGSREMSIEAALGTLAFNLLGQAYVIRGDCLLLTSTDNAARLSMQRRALDWASMELSRDEAERIGATLRAFFPADTELTTSSEVLLVRGREESIPRAARLLALLKPGSPDAIYPAAPPVEPMLETLEKRVDLMLSADDPLYAIDLFKRQGVKLFAASPSTSPEGTQERFPSDLQGMAPLRLGLKQLPLGLAMRWLERRSRIITQEQPDYCMAYAISPEGRVLFRLQPKNGNALEYPVAGADVSFLYKKGAEANAASDKDVRKEIVTALESHLALFPKLAPERDLQVIRGRLLMQGPAVTLRTLLDLIVSWRRNGAVPAPAKWKQELDQSLDQQFEWTGKDPDDAMLTVGRLIPTLRKLGKINILLEDAPDGGAGELLLKPSEAKLLPPGRHNLRELLTELSNKTGAQWQVELGVVTITPKAKKK